MVGPKLKNTEAKMKVGSLVRLLQQSKKWPGIRSSGITVNCEIQDKTSYQELNAGNSHLPGRHTELTLQLP